MKLREKQHLHAHRIALLILHAEALGYRVTMGDAYRDPRAFGRMGKSQSYGRKFSLHKRRLANDLNLFRDGKYLTETSDHEPLGEYWESLGGTWGGRFNDGNHYSTGHNGRR